ncbi:hypothetical protein [Microaceticoccus formicicus]|uniref:hypothetical protein n=1 Tax=Microaceticoccus formicicus TaxID=3118105 RepID=UPI003CD04DAF|nr:hypothetical protein VZL98_01615 [Peptoniphilaceae bacterium AMB_02]
MLALTFIGLFGLASYSYGYSKGRLHQTIIHIKELDNIIDKLSEERTDDTGKDW